MNNVNGQRQERIKLYSGAFVLLGLVLLVIFIFTIGRDKGLTQSKFKIEVLFNNVGGLSEGAPVLLSGVNVGTVDSIDFLEKDISGRNVRVKVNIFTKYRKQLEQHILCAIKTEGVLGEKIMEISVDNKSAKTDLTQPIVGEDPLDVQDIAEAFSGAAKSFTKTAEELGQIDMVELSQIMKESSEALLVTAKGMNSIMDELQEITIKAKRIMGRVEQKIIEGNLFKVF